MQTHLAAEFAGTPEGTAAEAVLRQCVHCGFCTATCPTYQLLGDELDGPRGRIYLVKQMLEGHAPTRSTQLHLDRCLTCRGCETTCPSGVQYGRLAEIGRHIADARVARPWHERLARWALREGLTSRWFAPALALGQAVRPLLPAALRAKVPPREPAPRGVPMRRHPRKVLLLAGCVQPALRPSIHAATVRVLDAIGIEAVVAPAAGCCGAIRSHLSDPEGGRDDMRRNVDAWWPLLADGTVECIVSNASGCGAMLKDYGHALSGDAAYADRAAQVAAAARDLSELLPEIAAALGPRLSGPAAAPIAFHAPCTLQHGQKLRGLVERQLAALGFTLRTAGTESHLCCGSAGTYSVLQPALAGRLRERKLKALGADTVACVASANIGCIQHLQAGTATPVRHWIELVDSRLPGAS